MVAVAHSQAVNRLVEKPGHGGRGLPRGQLVNDEQIHPQVVQLSLIVGHLRRIPVAAALVVDDPRGEVVKCLPAPHLVRLQKLHALGQLPWRHLAERLVLAAGEIHVRVVVPGNEPVVAHRPDQGSRVQTVADLILAADPVHLF